MSIWELRAADVNLARARLYILSRTMANVVCIAAYIFVPLGCSERTTSHVSDVGTAFDEDASALDPPSCQTAVSGRPRVLLLSSSVMAIDQAVVDRLEQYGLVAVVGPTYDGFDGTTSLIPYDVVYVQANANWGVGDMPLDGQEQLLEWVQAGGGMLTGEWTTWKAGGSQFTILRDALPARATNGYTATATVTYSQSELDPLVHDGLPSTFTFEADSFGGTEVALDPKDGATTFFESAALAAGVIGWDVELGRVASLSTTAGPLELSDEGYGRMFLNLIRWLSCRRDQGTGVTQL